MLPTWDVTSATDAKNYYASSMSPRTTMPPATTIPRGRRSPGKWGGKLAERLGLSGKVIERKRSTGCATTCIRRTTNR